MNDHLANGRGVPAPQPRTRRSWGRLSPLVFLIASAPAYAAAEADEAGDREAGETILVQGQRATPLDVPQSTGSRLGLSILETPASIAVVDGETLRARGDLSVQDAVSRSVGITNVGNPGNGGSSFSARGFSDQGSVMQLVDGIRLFPVAGSITFPTDPWMADRIEVLSGPASVLYGQGALGGAINIVTREPKSDRLSAQGEIGYGSQDSFRASAGIGGPISDQLSFRADGSYRHSDGYVDRGDSETFALSGALRFAPNDTFSLTLRHDYGDQRPSKYFGTPVINGRIDDIVRDRNFNVADGQIHYRDNRTTVTLEWSPAEGITITNNAYRLTSKRLWRNLEYYRYNPTTALVDRSGNTGIIHDQEQIGNVGSARLSLPLGGGITNDLVIGFDVNRIKLTYSHDFGSDPQEDSVDPFNPAPGLFFDTQGIAPRYRTRTNEYAFFAEDRMKLNEQFSIVAGIRHEEDRVRRYNFVYAGEAIAGEAQLLDKRLKNTTWRIGGVYQPTEHISLYGQYSTGVDPLGTLTTLSTGQVNFSNATGDQFEIGIKASFLNGHGSATLAAYRIAKKKLLIQRTLFDPVQQVGQRSAEGVEAAVSIYLPAGFGIDANGTVLRARYDDFVSGGADYTGNVPSGVAETAANLWLRWDPIERFQVRTGLRYVGRRFSDEANAFRVPGYAVIDTGLSYAVTGSVALDLRVYNLFDKDYAASTYDNDQWVLGRPRAFDLSLRASF